MKKEELLGNQAYPTRHDADWLAMVQVGYITRYLSVPRDITYTCTCTGLRGEVDQGGTEINSGFYRYVALLV